MYGPGEGQMMVRWSGEAQVTVRLGSNLKSFLSLTLVDMKLVRPRINGEREPESSTTFYNASSTNLLTFSRVSGSLKTTY